MPQGPITVRDVLDATAVVYNITAATALKTVAGRVITVNVVAASTAVGGLFDATATGSATASRQIAAIPATVGMYPLDWPYQSGLVVAPGAGMTIAISLS